MTVFLYFLLIFTVIFFFIGVLNILIKVGVMIISRKYRCPTAQRSNENLKIAIHMAIRNEDPKIVIRTINILLKQRYKDFMIIVIDNNTVDYNLWGPVKEFCKNYENILFIHKENVTGFKSGALNIALQHTPEDVELVSVIDCDTDVHENYLLDLVPFFYDSEIQVVQSPSGAQLDSSNNAFKDGLNIIHRSFNSFYMEYSNIFKSAPIIGNMGIIRKSKLLELGKWNGKYLCEDMELSRRLILNENKSIYVDVCYGKTLLPHSLKDARQQFFRWSFGNAQIFKDYFLKDFFKRPIFSIKYYVIPSIHLNLTRLPINIIITLVLIVTFFTSNSNILLFINYTVFMLLISEMLFLLIWGVTLHKKEGFSTISLIKSLLIQRSLYFTFSLATYKALLGSKLSFKITPHHKDQKDYSILEFLMKYFKFDIITVAIVGVLLIAFELTGRTLDPYLLINSTSIFIGLLTVIIVKKMQSS